jgi:hypothetical protein
MRSRLSIPPRWIPAFARMTGKRPSQFNLPSLSQLPSPPNFRHLPISVTLAPSVTLADAGVHPKSVLMKIADLYFHAFGNIRRAFAP